MFDLGTGPGTQAIALAKRGFEVTATDISETAVTKARRRAGKEEVTIEFLRDDILESRVEGPFHLVLDRGCFHVLEPDRRGEYVETVHRLLEPGGHLFLKCFSNREPGDEGPYRIARQEVADLFEPKFDIVSTNDSIFRGKREPPPRAIFFVLEKR